MNSLLLIKCRSASIGEWIMRALLLAAVVLFGVGTSQAFAQAQLVQADPPVDSAVREAPVIITLRFSEVPRLPGSGVVLIGPDGKRAVLGPLAHDPGDPMTLLAPTPRGLGPGAYKVHWGTLSPDARRTQGDFAFTIQP